jgi:enolase
MMNILNGGAHADNDLAIQEFMIIPSSAKTIKDAIKIGCEIFANLKKILTLQNLNTSVGDEGGFAPKISTSSQALDLIIEAIKKAGYKPGTDVNIALDAAASEFYKNGKYLIDGLELSTDQMVEYYKNLVNNYPIVSIEDPFFETDDEGLNLITEQIGDKVQIVGDDAFCTNPSILLRGIEKNLANALLVKPNQIGTLTETIKAVTIAKQNGYNTILSHRSGESEDVSIAHIAVALSSGQIKTGSLSRTDRTAKYNELIRIEFFLNS